MDAKLELIHSRDDWDFSGPEYQDGLYRVVEELRQHGMHATAIGVHQAADDLLGHYLIPVAQVVAPAFGVVIAAWLQSRAGRKARLKIGDVEAEARSPDEVEALLQAAKRYQKDAKAADGREGEP